MKNKGLVNIYSSTKPKGPFAVAGTTLHCLTALILLSLVRPVEGYSADIRIRSGLTVNGGSPVREIRLRSVNDGPFSVYELKAVMESPWKTSESLVRPVWPVHAENRVLFTVTPPKEARGGYPLVVSLKFRDSAGIPVTVYEMATVSAGKEGTVQGLDLVSAGADLEINGELHGFVRNTGGEPKTVLCRLVAPPSLAVVKDRIETVVGPRSSCPVNFHIMNRYAAAGTEVPVFVIAETDAGGIHGTTFIRSGIRILTAREARWPLRGVLWVVFVLSGGYAAVLFYRQTA